MTGWVMGGCDDTGCMASGSFSPIMLSPICILAVLGRGIWRAGALCHASLGPSTCLDLAQSRCSTCILTLPSSTLSSLYHLMFVIKNQAGNVSGV